jgi:hypothetical protein
MSGGFGRPSGPTSNSRHLLVLSMRLRVKIWYSSYKIIIQSFSTIHNFFKLALTYFGRRLHNQIRCVCVSNEKELELPIFVVVSMPILSVQRGNELTNNELKCKKKGHLLRSAPPRASNFCETSCCQNNKVHNWFLSHLTSNPILWNARKIQEIGVCTLDTRDLPPLSSLHDILPTQNFRWGKGSKKHCFIFGETKRIFPLEMKIALSGTFEGSMPKVSLARL